MYSECLATLKNCDIAKQSVYGRLYIYIYIYIYIQAGFVKDDGTLFVNYF